MNGAAAQVVWSDSGLPPRAAKPGRYHWITREIAIVRECYPRGGMVACLERLPGRTPGAIYQQASTLGLTGGRQRANNFRKRYHATPAIDEQIRRTYQERPTAGAINDLAERLGRPRWWVSKRACQLGLVPPRFKQPDWTEEEDEVLERNGHKGLETIRRLLARQGFRRSTTAIKLRLNRGQFDRIDPQHYTATALATCFGVDIKVVTGWIRKGWLKAARRGTARTPRQGGDQYWIQRRDVRAFVIDNAAPVDLRKVDKFWFIDLLGDAAL